MLIPKNVTKIPITNPFRPRAGIHPVHTICKLSWGMFEVEQGVVEERLRVDADHIDGFEDFINTIPREDRHRCGVYDVWLIKKEWKQKVLDKAKELFDETKTELRKWK